MIFQEHIILMNVLLLGYFPWNVLCVCVDVCVFICMQIQICGVYIHVCTCVGRIQKTISNVTSQVSSMLLCVSVPVQECGHMHGSH